MAEVKEQTTYQEPEVVIDVQNLSVGFHVRSKKTHVIRNISFKVYRGETLAIVTLTTNSPLRPIVNLFIAGWLE